MRSNQGKDPAAHGEAARGGLSSIFKEGGEGGVFTKVGKELTPAEKEACNSQMGIVRRGGAAVLSNPGERKGNTRVRGERLLQ